MTRVPPITYEKAQPPAREEWDRQVAAHGRMTNLKQTLARSPVALDAYMRWYPLRDEVAAFLGERTTLLFVHAISSESDCLVCSTYFRRFLIESGENPDDLELSEKDAAFVEVGRRIVRDSHRVTDAVFEPVSKYLTPDQIVSLIALAGLMIATNIFINVLDIDLDAYLEDYRGGGPS